jgi:hypothetical protein
MELPTIEVRAQGLAVEAEGYAGSRATPNIFHSATNIFMVLRSSWHSRKVLVMQFY